MLSQIGEFSFVLAAVGLEAKIISGFGYQLVISVITLSLIVSPLWIGAFRRMTHFKKAALPAGTLD